MLKALIYIICLIIPIAFAHADFQITNKDFRASGYFQIMATSSQAVSLGIIDYVEYGSITLAASSSSGTYTLSRSYPSGLRSVFILGNDYAVTTGSAEDFLAVVTFDSANTIRASRFPDPVSSATTTVNFAVVEWDTQAIQSIQTVNIQHFGTTAKTQAITSVNASSTVLNVTGYTSTSTSNLPRQVTATITLNTGTQLKSERLSNTQGVTTTVEVIEFKPAVISSIQSVNVALPALSRTTVTINSVDTNRTMVTSRGSRSSGTGQTTINCYVELLNSTTLIAVRNTATNNCVYGVDVVEFNTGYISYAKNEDFRISASLVATSTIAATDVTKTLVNFLGFSVNAANLAAGATRCTLFSTTEVPCRRTTTSNMASTSINVIQSN